MLEEPAVGSRAVCGPPQTTVPVGVDANRDTPPSGAGLYSLTLMFDLPSLDGVDKVLISQQVVEDCAGPLYMYAARGGSVRAT